MQNFTGFYKKSIAGIGFSLGVFLLSQFSFANEPATSAENQIASRMITAGNTINNTAIDNEVTNSSTTNTSVTNSPVTASESTPPLAISPATITKPIPTPTKTNSASQLASLIGGLALILVLIYGLSWFVKRFSQGGFLHNPTMKIVSAMPLGTRERLMLVDVGGKQLLLGVTATRINTLHVFEEPVIQSEKAQPVTSDFSQKLMAILQQKNVLPVDDDRQKKSNP